MLDVLAVANVQAAEGPPLLQFLRVDLELLLGDLDIAVLILSEVLTVGIKGVNWRIVYLGSINLDIARILITLDELDIGDVLSAIVLQGRLMLNRVHLRCSFVVRGDHDDVQVAFLKVIRHFILVISFI